MGSEKKVTDANFQTEVLNSKETILIDFWAEWCGPCRMLGPVLERVEAANEGKVIVAKMNVDENPGVPQQYGIQGIPTLIFFKNGHEVERMVGFQSQEAIQRAIDDLDSE